MNDYSAVGAGPGETRWKRFRSGTIVEWTIVYSGSPIMKRSLVILLFILLAAASLWAASAMSVQVYTAQIRRTPSFLGPVVAELAYGDRVEILDEGRGWLQVRSESGEVGWMQESALTDKKVEFVSSGSTASGASSEEVALAGKGFNAEIENEYRSGSDLDFAWVDEMEGWAVPTEDLVAVCGPRTNPVSSGPASSRSIDS